MELRNGFQSTELGLFPIDWGVVPLDSIASVTSGKRLPLGHYVTDSVTPHPYIRVTDMRPGGLDVSDMKYVPVEAYPAISRYRIFEPDIFISVAGSLGIVGKIPAELNGANLTENANRISNVKCDRDYLLHVLMSPIVQDVIDATQTVGAQPKLALTRIRTFSIPLPPFKEEQTAIAAALSDVDALIAGLEKLIAKKRNLKQAAMQQLLTGQTRLPGLSGEWARTELRRLVSTPITDGPHMTPKFYDSGVPFLSVNNLANNQIDLTDLRYISQKDDELFARKCKPRKGDVLLGKAASVGKVAIVEDDFDFNIWSPIALARPHDQMYAKFLYYQLLSADCIGQIMLLTNVSSQGNIGMGDIEKIQISYPDLKEQQAIASLLSDMDIDLSTLESRLVKTRALKQGMMQELLTGRTRLVEPVKQSAAPDQQATKERKANVYFIRSVLAAEIVDQLHEEPTFGHVKFEKMLFLTEHLCQVDTGSTYRRKAAGPYDSQALRSIDSQLRKQQWFDAHKEGGRYRYIPLNKRGSHKQYFEQYFAQISQTFSTIINTFRPMDSEQCEIVATLYAAWNDLLRDQGHASDQEIVHEVLHNWHESKKRITEDRWLKALGWMRNKGFVPSADLSNAQT